MSALAVEYCQPILLPAGLSAETDAAIVPEVNPIKYLAPVDVAVGNAAVTLNGTVTYTAGTLSGNTSNTFIYGSGAAQNVISGSYNNLTINGGAGVTKTMVNVATTLSVSGTYTHNATVATANANFTLNGAVTYTAGSFSGTSGCLRQ